MTDAPQTGQPAPTTTHIFIDESGDTGFKFGKGSSSLFSLAAVVFDSEEAMNTTEEAIQQLKHRMHRKRLVEFHYTHESLEIRRQFQSALSGSPFRSVGVVIEKALLQQQQQTIPSAEILYEIAIDALFAGALPALPSIRLVMDGKINRQLATHIRRQFNRSSKVVASIKFVSSAKTPLIQLADMEVGRITADYLAESGQLRKRFAPHGENDIIWIYR